MAIGDIFRPKHRHSNADIRAEAVQALGPGDIEIATEVARDDDDPQVRRLALDRIEDPERLVQLAGAEKNGDVRAHARARAVSLWVARATAGSAAEAHRVAQKMASLGEERAIVEIATRLEDEMAQRAVADCIDDPRALGELVRTSNNSFLINYVLDRLEDLEVLRGIAMDEQRKDVALTALGRIADREVIEAIAARGKSKAVRSRANKILAGYAHDEMTTPSKDKQRHAERVQLVSEVEKLASGNEWVESYARMTAAEARWEALGAGRGDEELAARFARGCERYFAGYERYGRQQRQQEAGAEGRKVGGTVTASTSTSTVSSPSPSPSPPSPSPSPSPSMPTVTPTPTPTSTSHSTSTGTGTGTEEVAEAEGEAKRAKEEQRAKNLAALEQLCERLEQLGGIDRLKNAEKRLAQIESAHREIGALPSASRKAATDRYEEARRKAVIRIAELREAEGWKRWANVPKQEQLVARVKELLEKEPSQQLADELKALQAEWKEVGAASRDKGQDLWNQFKAAADQVYEKVKTYRSQRGVEEKENLRLKEELCVKAEALAESTDWQQTAQELKQLQAEWKGIGPVPRRQSEAIWKRFRGACDRFFERRKPIIDEAMSERNRAIEEKQAVVDKAEALLSSTDWDAAVEMVGELRHQWRRTGQVPPRQFAELSERFKNACDGVFRARDEARDAVKNAERAEIEALRAATQEALSAEPIDAPALAGKTLELRNAGKRIAGDHSEAGRELRAAIDELCRRAIETQPAAFRGTELDPDASRRRKEKLCARVEELVQVETPQEGPPTTAEDMAARLRAALADRALGGVLSKHSGGRSADEVVREARESWARLGPVPGPEGLALEQRFEQACQRARG